MKKLTIAGIVTIFLILAWTAYTYGDMNGQGKEIEVKQTMKGEKMMAYTVKDFSRLLGMAGFSEVLLKNHFTLYQGYVTNTNKVLEIFEHLLKEGKTGTPEYAELKRRFGWEFNGMRLHELYFDNLGGKTPLDVNGRLGRKLRENFGNYEAWEKDFQATGAIRGIGWTIL
jgi:superoxide dismutase, Fe-Mn family